MPTIVHIRKDRKEFLIPIPADKFERFEKYHGQGSIERILTLLADERLSLRDIGAKVGLSYETIRHFFKDYLVPKVFLPQSRIRMSIRYRKKRLKRGVPNYILAVWRKARRQGIKVEPVARKIARHQKCKWRSALNLNSTLCKIHLTTHISPSLPYYQVNICKSMLESYPLHIVVIAPRGDLKTASFFIIPSHDLLKKREAAPRGTHNWQSVSLYFPTREHSKESPHFLERFRDAWHLLK